MELVIINHKRMPNKSVAVHPSDMKVSFVSPQWMLTLFEADENEAEHTHRTSNCWPIEMFEIYD